MTEVPPQAGRGVLAEACDRYECHALIEQQGAVRVRSESAAMNENELPESFLSLPRADQQLILDRYRELFEQLEAEWRSNLKNAGKPFSYSRMWDEFVNETDGEASA